MAVVPINFLKTKFETGDRPNGQDYADLIDTASYNALSLGAEGNNLTTVNGIEMPTVFDEVDTAIWRSIKYYIQVSHAGSGYHKSYEMDIVFDGTNLNISEYGIISNTQNEFYTISASLNAGIINMTVTPTITPVTVRFYRTGLKV